MNKNDTKNTSIPGYTNEWSTDFSCPHCNEHYEHTNETWDYVGFDGNDTQENIYCRKCDQQFIAELSVVCVYRAFASDSYSSRKKLAQKVSPSPAKPMLRVIQGGKKQ